MNLRLSIKTSINNKSYLKYILPVVFFLLWYFITLIKFIKPLYLPSPFSVLDALIDTKDTILFHIFYSLYRLTLGYLIGIALGFSIGLLMKYNDIADKLLYKLVETWRPIPPVALLPFFLLWFGFSDFGKIILVILGVSLIIVVNTYEAINNVNPIFIKAAYSLGASKTHIFKTVVIPAIIPDMKSGFRIALANGFTLVIVSEFMGADYGLGYLINISRITFSTQTIFLSILIIGTIAVFLDGLIQKITNKIIIWSPKISEAVKKN